MKDNIDFQFDFSTATYSVQIDSMEQFTNCLDGLLRDPYGNVIDLDSMDFEHQFYYGVDKNHLLSAKKNTRFVFKLGRLFKVPFETSL